MSTVFDRFRQRRNRKRFKRTAKEWRRVGGDSTLRVDYPLDADSIVFDVGGFRGDFAEEMVSRYNCTVHVFEPVPAYVEEMRERFANEPRVHIHPFGLGASTRSVEMSMMDDATSHVDKGQSAGTAVRVAPGSVMGQVVAFEEFVAQHDIDEIGLMKVNVEGAEFELLPHVIELGWIPRIRDLQLQFHLVLSDAPSRRQQIQRELARTHRTTYDYYFVWENWRRVAGADSASKGPAQLKTS